MHSWLILLILYHVNRLYSAEKACEMRFELRKENTGLLRSKSKGCFRQSSSKQVTSIVKDRNTIIIINRSITAALNRYCVLTMVNVALEASEYRAFGNDQLFSQEPTFRYERTMLSNLVSNACRLITRYLHSGHYYFLHAL